MVFIDEKWYGGTIRRGRRRMENKDLLTKEEIIKVWNDVGEGATWGEYTQAIARAQLSKVLDAGYEKLPKYDDDIVENLKGLIYTEIIDWATKEGMTDKVLDSIVRREIIPLALKSTEVENDRIRTNLGRIQLRSSDLPEICRAC